MGVTTKKLLISLSAVLGCTVFALPTFAASDYYANADTGSDDNSCLSADQPCLTIAGTETKMDARDNSSNITLHLAGTFNESVYIDDADVTAPNTLDGLRITATDPDNMPTINGGGAAYALEITDVHSVTVDHLNLTNARMGVYIGGDYIESVDGVTIKNNTITNITSTDDGGTAMGGIYLFYTKNVQITNNTIDGVNLTLTNGTSYESIYGIEVGNSLDVKVKNNTVNDVSITNDISADSTFHQGNTYGIHLSGTSNTKVRGNTVANITTAETTSVNNISMYANVYGISVSGGYDTLVRGNTIQTLNASNIATGSDVTGNATMYGLEVSSIQRHSDGNNIVRSNTITGLTMDGTAMSVGNYMYGVSTNTVEKLMLRNNTVSTQTGNGSSTENDNYINSVIYGFIISNLTQGTVRNNTVTGTVNALSQTGDEGSLNSQTYGMYLSASSNTSVLNNTLGDFSVTADNNDTPDYYDTLRTYGIYFYQGSNNVLRNNTIRDVTLDYASAGDGGNVYLYDYGIYTYRVENITIQKNTYRDITNTTTLTDPTGDSNAYIYSYGIYHTDASGASVLGNTLKNITHTGDSSTDCYIALTLYGIYVANSPNSQITNNVLKKYTHNTTARLGNNMFYGIDLSRVPDMLVSDNTIQSIHSTNTGTDHSSTMHGIYAAGSNPLYLNANVLRGNAITAESNTYMYGIYFNDDASKTYVTNNILLGADETDSEDDYGIYLKDAATKGVTLYHNTVASWNKAISILGGSNYVLKNNILTARGTGSHAIEVDTNQLDVDSVKSDYNLLYNATFDDQLVYDTGDVAAISFADWKQQYNHDRKSLNKKPKIKSNGKLKKASKAINHGTKNYGLAKKSLAYQLISTDAFGGKRPVTGTGRIDIGADEFVKKTK